MQGVFLFQERSTTMAKSRLQKEYEKELRLLERRIKALQKKTEVTFTPEEIEAVTKRKSRPRRVDIERLHALRGEELQTQISRVRKIEPTTGKQLPQVEVHTGRTPIPEIKTHKERELLPEEVKKERRNYRARVRRLEKQGYDTSNLKPAREYTTEELRQLKGKKLSEQAYKDGQTAYESRKQIKEQHRWFNKIQREADKTFFTAPPEPLNLPTVPDMIEYLTSVFESLENNSGVDIRADKDTLLALWNSILEKIGYPDNVEKINEYNQYLDSQEAEIASKCDQITWDSNSERISVCFSNLFWILERYQPLTAEESRTISDISERITYTNDVD